MNITINHVAAKHSKNIFNANNKKRIMIRGVKKRSI